MLRICAIAQGVCALVLALLLAETAYADETIGKHAGSEKVSALGLNLSRHTLPNGLRVVLNVNSTVPTVAICVSYDVGSRDETPGRSGFAHLFEHLMFQGSRNVAKGDHFRWITARGGQLNGTTNKDRTNYYQVLPNTELALGLWLEADRMKTLALNRANFNNQRQVVQEEYRMRYSNRPYRLGYIRLHQLVFQAYWPYEHPTIGFMEDLENAEFAWAQQFHQDFYVPNNAVLSVSGDIEPKSTLALIQEYFGNAQPEPRLRGFQAPAKEPRQTSERFSVVEDPHAKTPGVMLGWRTPSLGSKEQRALKLLSYTLAGGQSSNLYRTLVLKNELAQSVSAFTTDYHGPGAFVIRYQIAKKASVDAVQKKVDAELRRLRLAGPSLHELNKAKAQLKMHWLQKLENNRGRAIALGEFELAYGDATLLTDEIDAYSNLSRKDVRRAAYKTLLNTRRSIVEVYPPGWVRDLGPPTLTKTHTVRKGETLSGIAVRYGTSVKQLAKQNGISAKRAIRVGQRLLVTVTGSRARPARTHTVKKGETLIGIARTYGVTAKAIAYENNISTKKSIYPGQVLKIVGSTGRKKSKGSTRPQFVTKRYTVKKGDTLIGIARKLGVSAKELAKANKLSMKRHIRPGQVLSITVEAKRHKKPRRRAAKAKKRASKKKKSTRSAKSKSKRRTKKLKQPASGKTKKPRK